MTKIDKQHLVDLGDGLFGFEEQSGTCCGTLELGDMPGYSNSTAIVTRPSWYHYDDFGNEKTVEVFTDKEHDACMKMKLTEWKREYGLIRAYLLQNQHKSWLGSLLRRHGFSVEKTFYNPKTRRTLYPYTCYLRQQKPRPKKNSKRLFK